MLLSSVLDTFLWAYMNDLDLDTGYLNIDDGSNGGGGNPQSPQSPQPPEGGGGSPGGGSPGQEDLVIGEKILIWKN